MSAPTNTNAKTIFSIPKAYQLPLAIVVLYFIVIACAIGGPIIAQGILVLILFVICLVIGSGVGTASNSFGYGVIATAGSIVVFVIFNAFGLLTWLFDLFEFLGELSRYGAFFILCGSSIVLFLIGLFFLYKAWQKHTKNASMQTSLAKK